MLLKEQMKIIRENQKSAPVTITKIAHALGLKVFRSELPANVSGMLKKDDRSDADYSIYVNQAHSEVRRRFTIAHEIGHFILHLDLLKSGIVEDALLRAEGLSNATEAQANSFAADTLMPWNLISDAQDRGITTIEDLASLFKVSLDAMSIRLLGVSYQRAREVGAA